MPRILIVAYGNPLRSDDGLAWHAADSIEETFASSDVEILRTHQLTPEIADTIRRAEAVIFVDAASVDGTNTQPGHILEASISPTNETPPSSHHLSPGAVLALARDLYSASPRAFSVTLTGECFDHGDSLSLVVAAALPFLVQRIQALVQQMLSSETLPAALHKP